MPIVLRPSIFLLCVLAAACAAVPAMAEEPVLEFLHAAQDHGYGEASLDYLEQCRARGRMPKELAETLDLELSRSYRLAVGEAFNAAEAEQRLAKAQTHLDKFLKEHPNHPEVARAIESWGDIALDRALERLRAAAAVRDAQRKEKHLVAARADLEEARPRFVDATARYGEQYSKLKAAGEDEPGKKARASAQSTRKQRQAQDALRDAEATWLECRAKSAKIDFYVAETYQDRKAPQRKAALEAAAKAFDAIFQSYRESLAGLHAHMWHGRVADELGDDQLALDIYDEVLATAPDRTSESKTGLEPLFAQVQYLRLLVVLRKEGLEDFLAEANPWLTTHRSWEKFDGYQGVALEVAKANLQTAGELRGEKKANLIRSSLAKLAEISKMRGEHQQQAILLRREYTRSGSTDPATVKTFDEAMALGEAAAENLDWNGAAIGWKRALELKSTARDPKRVAMAQSRLDQACYQMAAASYANEKFEDCLSVAEQIAHAQPESPLAPRAASLAVAAALSLYTRAQDKPAALARLEKIAREAIERWPERAEADDARIALGQASLVRGDLRQAVDVFERVNPRSQRYPSALYLAAQTNWRLYLAARSKAADSQAEQLGRQRDKAEEQLRLSLAGQRKDAEPGKPLSRQMLETQLLLAEMKIDAGHTQEAAALVEPLVSWIQKEKPGELDATLLRVFLVAVRANLALGQLPKASAAANLLVELAPDGPQVNAVLDAILKLHGDHWKAAESAALEARSAADASGRAAAEAVAAASKQQLSQLLAKVATREHHSLAARIYIADTSAQLGQSDTARAIYQAILAQGEDDEAFEKTNAAALTRIRAQVVGLLRQKGQFAEGLAEVDKLIAAYPNALEPKMEKGRLLQGWADQDASHLPQAVAQWTMLRNRLAKAHKKPPEYYEVVFNAASCLYEDSRKTEREPNTPKALQAEQLLNATLVLSPQLSGPEMVAKYKELLAKVRQLQGRSARTSAKD